MKRCSIIFIYFCISLYGCLWHRYAYAQFSETAIAIGEGTQKIKGRLLTPLAHSSKKEWPVALIISDAGVIDRDGNAMGSKGKNNALKLLAEELAIAGFASVRYDKRGIGESQMPAFYNEQIRVQMFVDDVKEWIKNLAMDKRFASIYLIGHGEGATIGLLAAIDLEKDPTLQNKLKAYISLAQPAESAGKNLREQLGAQLPPDLVKEHERILAQLEKGKRVQDVPPALMMVYHPNAQDYLIQWLKIVPKNLMKTITLPTAIFHGEMDTQVSAEDAIQLSKSNPRAETQIFPNMNHVLKDVVNDIDHHNNQAGHQVNTVAQSYTNPLIPLDADMVKALIQFLRAQTPSPTKAPSVDDSSAQSR